MRVVLLVGPTCGGQYTDETRVPELLTDIPIQRWRESGLNTASTIRVHKLTVLAKDDVARRLGILAESDRTALIAALRRVFSLDV